MVAQIVSVSALPEVGHRESQKKEKGGKTELVFIFVLVHLGLWTSLGDRLLQERYKIGV